LRQPIRAGHILAAALVVHAVIAVFAVIGTPIPKGDWVRYYEIATTPGRPYLDYHVEHPIGTLLVFKALAAATSSRAAFTLAIVALNIAADAAILWALAWGYGLGAAAAFAVVVLPVLDLLFNRIDLWSTACATIAVAAWQRERPVVTALFAPLGGALKLWPLPFVLLLLRPRRGRASAAAVGIGAAMLCVVGLVWLGVAGVRGLYDVVTFREATGWQIESLVGSIVHAAGAPSMRIESGSWRIGEIPTGMSIVLFLLAAPGFAWAIWKGASTDRVGLGWLAGVSLLLVCSALLSAQFIGWLTPATAIAWTRGDRRQAAIAAAAIVLTAIFWKWYWAVIQSVPVMDAVVVVRNVVLIALAIEAIRALRAAPDVLKRSF
jgi:hypothetical protein